MSGYSIYLAYHKDASYSAFLAGGIILSFIALSLPKK
jgi:hypothetical protein